MTMTEEEFITAYEHELRTEPCPICAAYPAWMAFIMRHITVIVFIVVLLLGTGAGVLAVYLES